MEKKKREHKETKTVSRTKTIPTLAAMNLVILFLTLLSKGFIFDASILTAQILLVELTLIPSLIMLQSFVLVLIILLIAVLIGPPFFGLTHLFISWITVFLVYIYQRQTAKAVHEIDELLKLESRLSTHGYNIEEVEEKILESLKTNEIVHIHSISNTLGVDQDLLIQVVQKMLKEEKIQCLMTTDNQKLIPLTVLKEDILKELERGENPSVAELSKKLGVENTKLINAIVNLVESGQFENYFRKYS